MRDKGVQANRFEMDMTSGPIFHKLILFSLPLIASGILQLLFNAADIAVIGNYGSDNSLAAVGCTNSLVNLTTNLFLGMSVGANVLLSSAIGAKREKEVSLILHTAITGSLLLSIPLMVLGLLISEPLLTAMGTPADVLPLSVMYVRILFIGAPSMMVYNFGASVMRSFGDTKRPLYYLTVAGFLNVILNVFFVTQLKLDVMGVSLATVISQTLSAGLVINALMHMDGALKLSLKKCRLHGPSFLQMLKIGIPAGLQGSIFSFSNVLIQSTINTFGTLAMAGSTASSSLEGFTYIAVNAFSQACVSFTGQNFGARKWDRMRKIMGECLLLSSVLGLFIGSMTYLFSDTLLHIYTSNPAVIPYGQTRLLYICVPTFLCGFMEVFSGAMRGMGVSVTPMVITLTGACAFRILWLNTVFLLSPTLETLFIVYPISWIITSVFQYIAYRIVRKKKMLALEASPE